ncbi:hypothetical protein INT45_002245, partial [Circinella minor]
MSVIQIDVLQKVHGLPQYNIQIFHSFNKCHTFNHLGNPCEKWYTQLIQQHTEPPSLTDLKSATSQHSNNNLSSKRAELSGLKTLAGGRNTLGVDPIMWLPMTRKERSRCIRRSSASNGFVFKMVLVL